jgi:catalase
MALTFELSKVETPVIRERMVAHLLNIDEGLAETVADKLGIKELPKPADTAVAPRNDLEPSPALSIIENGPDDFAGRKVGVLVSPGADAALLKKLQSAIEKEGAVMEVIAPKVGGVEAADGSWIEAKHMVDGGPSVLFDAVALILSEEGAEHLTGEAAARDFVADAFAHCKFIGFTAGAVPLFQKAGVDPEADEGLIGLDDPKSVANFIESCRKLRLWSREMAVKL